VYISISMCCDSCLDIAHVPNVAVEGKAIKDIGIHDIHQQPLAILLCAEFGVLKRAHIEDISGFGLSA